MTTDEIPTHVAVMIFMFATLTLLIGVIWIGHLRYMMGVL